MIHGFQESFCFECCPIVEAWCNSSKVVWIKPRLQVAGVSFKVGKPDMSGYYPEVVAPFDPDRHMYKAYIPPRFFKQGGIETRYKIILIDAEENRSVMGEGKLRVFKGKIPDANDGTDVCYLKFPDNTWREILLTKNELGDFVYTVLGEVYDDAEFESITNKTPYSYNKGEGKFYALKGFFDEYGEAGIEVTQTESALGVESFIYNDVTGFYYRIESEKDETGTESLVIGDFQVK